MNVTSLPNGWAIIEVSDPIPDAPKPRQNSQSSTPKPKPIESSEPLYPITDDQTHSVEAIPTLESIARYAIQVNQ